MSTGPEQRFESSCTAKITAAVETPDRWTLVVDQLARAFNNQGVEAIDLEAAHIYGDEVPNLEHFREMSYAAGVSRRLVEMGFALRHSLFIDNFHSPNNEIAFNVDYYKRVASRLGWHVDKIYFENSMIGGAESIIATLENRGLVGATEIEQGVVRKSLKRGDVDLINAKGEQSCAALDAAFALERWNDNDNPEKTALLTIMPHTHINRSQQRNVRRILRSVRNQDHLPYFNLFFNQNGRFIVGAPHQAR